MRIRERIPNFLDKLCPELLHKIFLGWFGTNFEEAELKICKEKRKIKKFWIANHDLRFSQVLVNMGYIDNIPGGWYYLEDDVNLLLNGIPSRDCLFWGQNYDADMNRLPETKWILIKNMTLDHINAVIAFMGERLPQRYKDAFQAELELRNVG
jgi:hypothetical protein